MRYGPSLECIGFRMFHPMGRQTLGLRRDRFDPDRQAVEFETKVRTVVGRHETKSLCAQVRGEKHFPQALKECLLLPVCKLFHEMRVRQSTGQVVLPKLENRPPRK